jgi:hypothetical protein
MMTLAPKPSWELNKGFNQLVTRYNVHNPGAGRYSAFGLHACRRGAADIVRLFLLGIPPVD